MKEVNSDLFNYIQPIAICIPTNGVVDKNGSNVMGAGFAKNIKNRYPDVPAKLGNYINKYGNRAFNLGIYMFYNMPIRLISFPTKYNWKDDSDLTLITKSCEQVIEIADKYKINHIYLPAPGIGCGNLNYETTVKPVIELMLDDRFTVFRI